MTLDRVSCSIEKIGVGMFERYWFLPKRGFRKPVSEGSGIVARCPICEIEFVSTVYALSNEMVEKLKDAWVKKEALAEVSP